MSSFLNLKLIIAKKPWWKSLTSKIQKKLKNKKFNSSNPKLPSNKRPNKYKFSIKSRFRRKNKKPRLAHVHVDRLFRDAQPLINVLVEDKKKHLLKETLVDHDRDHDDHGVDRTAVDASSAPGDIMWESMGLASPLMHGIDARAEKFIAKFRADMEVQEKLARRGL